MTYEHARRSRMSRARTAMGAPFFSLLVWAAWKAVEFGVVPDLVAPICTGLVIGWLYAGSRA